MSAIARSLLRPATTSASRRYYSSFFSSNSGGGGRYFNSAKHSKVVVTNATSNANATKLEPGSESSSDGAQASGSNKASTNANPPRINASSEQSSPNAPPHSSATSPPSQSSVSEGTTTDAPKLSSSSAGTSPSAKSEPLQRQQYHPVVNPKDFKLHQFFSVYRPLLLLANPALIMDTVSPGATFIPPEPTSPKDAAADLTHGSPSVQQPPSPPIFLDDFPESTPDGDAAAARQLHRALTMHHAGAAVAWEDTLRRLGIDVDKEREADRTALQKQWVRDWQEVMMDSVKRKRRKKMKKHKLKKRRRATRAQRMKIGR